MLQQMEINHIKAVSESEAIVSELLSNMQVIQKRNELACVSMAVKTNLYFVTASCHIWHADT